MKEYSDGILLYNISYYHVLSHPIEEQPKLEAEWLKELNGKYKVKIHQKVLNNLKQYLPVATKK